MMRRLLDAVTGWRSEPEIIPSAPLALESEPEPAEALPPRDPKPVGVPAVLIAQSSNESQLREMMVTIPIPPEIVTADPQRAGGVRLRAWELTEASDLLARYTGGESELAESPLCQSCGGRPGGVYVRALPGAPLACRPCHLRASLPPLDGELVAAFDTLSAALRFLTKRAERGPALPETVCIGHPSHFARGDSPEAREESMYSLRRHLAALGARLVVDAGHPRSTLELRTLTPAALSVPNQDPSL